MISVQTLKQRIRNMSTEKKIPYEVLYQNFFFEHFLERLSNSIYCDSFVLKGGFMLTVILGIEGRSTSDLDMTVDGLQMTEDKIKDVITKICELGESEVSLEVTNTENIRHEDKYEGLRVTINGDYKGLSFPFKLDLSTGDQITPAAIERNVKLSLSGKNINLMTYPFETVLAEKLETILSRGVANTRSKDFFDVYAINKFYTDQLDYKIAKDALIKTMSYRETLNLLEDAPKIINTIENDEGLAENWGVYTDAYFFADNVEYSEVIGALKLTIQYILSSDGV